MTFWNTLATFCNELAPVTGPLLQALGDTAGAIERADRAASALESADAPRLRASRDA